MTFAPVAEVLIVVAANGVVAWAITYLVHSTALIGAAALVDRTAALSGLDRVRMWRLAVGGPFLTSIAHMALAAGRSPASLEVSTLAPPALADASVGLLTLSAAALAALVPVAGWVRGRVTLRRTIGARLPLAAGPVRDRLDELAAAGRRPVRLTTSDRLVVPAAIGRAEICVPARVFAAFPADEQRALLAHELGHLRGRDPIWLAVMDGAARLAFVQPLNRVAMRRLRAASEQAADDFAVRLTHNPLALARALASIATLLVVIAGGAAAAGSPVYERVSRLLDPTRWERPPMTRRAAVAAGAALLVAWTLLVPGVSLSAEAAANRIPWLTPSKAEPNARMLEVRRFERGLRNSLPRVLR